MNPFVGVWTANIEKSYRHANHQFGSATLTTVLHADGRDHSVSPQVPGVVVATRWVGTNVLETVAKKDGQVVGHGTYEVSLDGATLTATVAGTDAAGKPFEQVIVFDASQGR